jgi:hypothetical protein
VDSTDFIDPADDTSVEIVTVTARAADTLTVTRGAEGTAATNKNTGGKTYIMVLSITKALHDEYLTGEVGTIALFQQTTAPVGWTKNATHNDKTLRVVSGTASSGGATAFSSVFGAGKVTGSHTLTEAELASHVHNQTGVSATDVASQMVRRTGAGGATTFHQTVGGTTANVTAAVSTVGAGSGSGHTHTLSLDLHYVDVILCTKD